MVLVFSPQHYQLSLFKDYYGNLWHCDCDTCNRCYDWLFNLSGQLIFQHNIHCCFNHTPHSQVSILLYMSPFCEKYFIHIFMKVFFNYIYLNFSIVFLTHRIVKFDFQYVYILIKKSSRGKIKMYVNVVMLF